MGSLPNLHELGGKEAALAASARHDRPRQLLARVPTAPANHQRVYKSKSNGHAANHVNDDLILDVSAYSPVSGRCGRTARRRDSLSSSIGATSVRRLIGAVGRGGARSFGGYRVCTGERRRTARALLALCAAHATAAAALLPFLALQAGGGAWAQGWGPPLCGVMFIVATVGALVGPAVVQRCGPHPMLLVFNAVLAVFFASHLVPSPAVLLPLYILVGFSLGFGSVARTAALLGIATRLAACSPPEDEDTRAARRTTLLRRAARALHFAHDLGLILGSALAAAVITFTMNTSTTSSDAFMSTNLTMETINVTANCSITWGNETWCGEEATSEGSVVEWTETSGGFEVDDSGERICGARACPATIHLTASGFADVLAGVFATLAILALLAAGAHTVLRPRDHHESRPGPPALRAVLDSFKDFRLQLAAPLAMFIGMEQAYMFTDFTKSYVVCTLGIERVPLVFLSQGLLQSVAAATLSMLLRSIQRRRCLVVAVGLAFHACLLLVQLVWKPSGDDPALFYVISAAWGVCHAIWEQLSWTLLTGAYGDNVSAATAAFGNAVAWRFFGMAVVFAVHGLICVRAQLHALAAALLLASLPAAALEQRLHNLRKLRSISRL